MEIEELVGINDHPFQSELTNFRKQFLNEIVIFYLAKDLHDYPKNSVSLEIWVFIILHSTTI